MLPISYLTKGTESKGSALPELANCKSARIVYASEPDSSGVEKLQASFIKSITGNDPLTVRGLYKEPITYQPQFTTILLCNSTKFNRVDIAIKRRLRMVEFPFEFKSPDDYKADIEHQRLADRHIEIELQKDSVRDTFMCLLLDIYKREIFGRKDIAQPPAVKNAIKEYLDDNNPVIKWLHSKVDTNAGESDRIGSTELLNMFNADTSRDMTAKDFGTLMSTGGYNSKRSNSKIAYWGFKLIDSL